MRYALYASILAACGTRLFEGEPPTPSLAQAKELAASANLSVDAQEQRAKDIIAAKDQVITDTQTALDLANTKAVDQELIDAIKAIGDNAEDNFQSALRKGAGAKKR